MAAGALFAWRQGLGAWWPPAPAATDTAEEGSPRAVLRFSLRSMFSAFSAVEHFQADVLLVGLLLSAHQFGLYAAGAAFANLPEFLGQSVGYIAYPEVRAARAERRAATLRRYLAIGTAVLVPVVLVSIALLGWLLPLLFGHQFSGAVTIGRILLIAALAQGLRRVAAEGLRGLGSGTAATLAELSFIVVFVAAVVPLADAHGGSGAAAGLLIASVVGAAALFALALRQRSEAR
jgi:O-antigen/teichoic acid export membrane protein